MKSQINGSSVASILARVCFLAVFAVALTVRPLQGATESVPVIVTEPVGFAAVIGFSVTFSVNATGASPLNYQWLKIGVPITGATSATLTLENLAPSDAGSYQVLVSNVFGVTPSRLVSLSVGPALEILEQPATQVRFVGDRVVLSVTARSSGVLAYQWYRNGVVIPGAVFPTFILPQAQVADTGSYRVLVSSAFGSEYSDFAVLVVSVTGTSNQRLITIQPVGRTVKVGTAASLSVKVSGAGTFTYQWFKGGDVIAGATKDVLSFSIFRRTDEGSYRVVVSNGQAAEASDWVSLSADEFVPPRIILSPVSHTNILGTNVAFFVEAVGLQPLSYQWLKNGSPIQAADTTNLILGPLVATNAASYSVLITNLLGRITSAAARLTVLLPPSILSHPANQAVLEGTSVSFFVDASGTLPLGFQWYKDDKSILNGTNRVLTLGNIRENDSGSYRAEVQNNYGNASSSNALLRVNIPATILSQPESRSVFEGTNIVLSVKASGTAPLTYEWLKNSISLRNATNEVLILENVSTNDSGKYRISVRNSFRSVTSSEAVVLVKPALQIVKQPQNVTVFNGDEIVLGVGVTGVFPWQFQWFKNKEILSGATDANLSFRNANSGHAGVYSVFVSNSLAGVLSSNVVVSVKTSAGILEQPKSQTVSAGADVTFTVTAEGDAPLSYQWLRNGTKIQGATNQSLTLNKVRFVDSGVFKVLVKNPYNQRESFDARLDVDPGAVIIRQPASETVLVGANIMLDALADGELPMEYTWFRNGMPIRGATNASFVIDRVQVSDSGSYRLLVGNRWGTASSVEALLTVIPPIVISKQPASQTVLEGTELELEVEASGFSRLRYQWFLNSEAISGATNQSFGVSNVSESREGVYTVRIENDHGSLISSNAIVRVRFPSITPGDFDKDGSPEIVFENASGFLASWFMNGTNMRFARFFTPENTGDSNWTVAGSADFDLDGNEDLLFERNDGSLAVWTLDQLTLRKVVLVSNGRAQGVGWNVAAVGDFDQDNKPDVLFQHESGTLVIWFLDRVELLSATFLNPPRTESAAWRILGSADFDRDSKEDLILQHTDGTLAVWYMNGTVLRSGALLNPSHPGDADWRVVSIADRNNDGRPDLLFQHAETGDLAVWFMDRNTLIEARLLNPYQTGKGWKVVAP